MKTYEERLMAAAHELYEKRVLVSPQPTTAPKIQLWLHEKTGARLPPVYYMSFLQIALFEAAFIIPIKLMLDYFVFSKPAHMTTADYWFDLGLFVLILSTWFATFYRLIAWRKKLSRWEDL